MSNERIPAVYEQVDQIKDFVINVKAKIKRVSNSLEVNKEITTQDIIDLHKSIEFLDQAEQRLTHFKE